MDSKILYGLGIFFEPKLKTGDPASRKTARFYILE